MLVPSICASRVDLNSYKEMLKAICPQTTEHCSFEGRLALQKVTACFGATSMWRASVRRQANCRAQGDGRHPLLRAHRVWPENPSCGHQARTAVSTDLLRLEHETSTMEFGRATRARFGLSSWCGREVV